MLRLVDVKRIAAAAEAEATRNGWEVTIAIVDRGGTLMYLQRDDIMIGTVDVAMAKAKCAIRFRKPTRVWAERIADGRLGVLSMPGIVAVEGGLPLFRGEELVGAIAVSGLTPEQDGQVAAAGAAVL